MQTLFFETHLPRKSCPPKQRKHLRNLRMEHIFGWTLQMFIGMLVMLLYLAQSSLVFTKFYPKQTHPWGWCVKYVNKTLLGDLFNQGRTDQCQLDFFGERVLNFSMHWSQFDESFFIFLIFCKLLYKKRHLRIFIPHLIKPGA